MDEETAGPSAGLSPLARARLDELLEELLERVDEVLDTQDRLRGLLDAVVAIASDLSLDSVLQRIVTVATQLAGAQYGAIGVLGTGPQRRLVEFVTEGLSVEGRERIGHLPEGHGLLGAIIDDPRPLRLPSLGDDSRSYGFPPNHPSMSTFLGVPIRIRDRVFGNLYLTEKHGGVEFTEEDVEVVVALAAAAGVVIENARLSDETARRQRWLEAGADVTSRLLGPLDEAEGRALVAEQAMLLAHADLGVLVLQTAPGVVHVDAVSGPPGEPLVGRDLAIEGTLIGQVLGTDEPVVVDGATADAPPGELGFVPPSTWPALGALLLLPMRGGVGVDGVLVLGWTPEQQEAFREVDPRLPAAFAEQAALALQVTKSREDQSRLAVLEDRDRIGRDLHDVVIQRLFAVGLSLEALAGQAADGEVTRRVSSAVDDLDITIRDIRRTIFELQSPRDSADLRRLLQSTVDEVTPALGFAPSFSTYGPVDSLVPATVRPHLIAVLREALTNVARHAEATAAHVNLDVADALTLTVRDDGRGYEHTDRVSGVANMAERARVLGGTFAIGPGASGGSVLTWQVPFDGAST